MKTTPETFDEAEPKTSDTSKTLDSEEGSAEMASRQRTPKRRRHVSRNHRDDHRLLRRYRPFGSTYRPNYDAVPERAEYSEYRREFRQKDQRYQVSRREPEPTKRDLYREYPPSRDVYDRPYAPCYPHDDNTWAKRQSYDSTKT